MKKNDPLAVDMDVPLESIVPDPENRAIDEASDRFLGLLDSVKVRGVLVRVHVQRQADGTFMLRDGERRWRAAGHAALPTLPCRVWPEGAGREVITAALAMEETKEAHGCLDVARTIRRLRNEHAMSNEQIAAETGTPLPRVKLYSGLFGASDELLQFFDKEQITLLLATEFMRYEKHCGEPAAKRLMKQHLKAPVSVREVAALRTNAPSRKDAAADTAGSADKSPRAGWENRFTAAWQKDPAGARLQLEQTLSALGYRIVPLEAGV